MMLSNQAQHSCLLFNLANDFELSMSKYVSAFFFILKYDFKLSILRNWHIPKALSYMNIVAGGGGLLVCPSSLASLALK